MKMAKTQEARSGLDFVNVMNETWVTFVRDLTLYGWGRDGSGWEACSPSGEICLFETEHDARVWRGEECRRSLARQIKLSLNATWGRESAVAYVNPKFDPVLALKLIDVNSLYPAEVEA
jgi:hypothetical protein